MAKQNVTVTTVEVYNSEYESYRTEALVRVGSLDWDQHLELVHIINPSNGCPIDLRTIERTKAIREIIVPAGETPSEFGQVLYRTPEAQADFERGQHGAAHFARNKS